MLRCYTPGDGALYRDAHTSSADHLKAFIGNVNPDMTVIDGEARVRKANAAYLTHKDFSLGIFSPDESRLLGETGFHLWAGPLSFGNAEIGMWIRADASGKGLGVAVLKAVIAWGFTAWGWDRLVWRASVRNRGSQRTAEKARMVLEATHRQMLPNPQSDTKDATMYYAILKEEWNPSI